MDVDTATPAAGPSTQPHPSGTVLSSLQPLLQAQQNVSSAYLHPYAPAPWKGKSRVEHLSVDDQLARVKDLRDALEGARNVLGGKDAGDWGRLSRALREVTTHSLALFPTSSALRPPPLPPVDLPSPAALLSPIDMLKTLAAELGVQTYLEDSQFGLLKTSLTLAGNRFVVDIDLETDSTEEGEGEGDNEDDEAMPPASGTKTPGERGKVRLAKLAANHVTKEGGTGKSDWIGTVLRESLERYLGVWNSSTEGIVDGAKKGMKLEECVRALREVLESLKWLDDIAVADETRDVYSELEQVAKRLQEMIAAERSSLFARTPSSLLPAFNLLPSARAYDPTFLLRPALANENVPPISTTEAAEADFPPKWIIQLMTQPGEPDGLPVRPSWLSPTVDQTDGATWNGAIKIENMLYAAGVSSAPQTFPYTAEFVHLPGGQKGKGLKQHWTMSQPGPDLYMVGRIGLPTSAEGLQESLNILRRQVVLNRLWVEVFDRGKAVEPTERSDKDADLDLDDILSSAPSDVPVSLKARSTTLDISFPCPGQAATPTIISLRVSPSSVPPAYFDVDFSVKGAALPEAQSDTIRAALSSSSENLITLVERVLRALES